MTSEERGKGKEESDCLRAVGALFVKIKMVAPQVLAYPLLFTLSSLL
jgi:hypothetical protein